MMLSIMELFVVGDLVFVGPQWHDAGLASSRNHGEPGLGGKGWKYHVLRFRF